MNTITIVWTWVSDNLGTVSLILCGLVAFDNTLAQIPAVKANSTFQFISGAILKFSNFIGGFIKPKV